MCFPTRPVAITAVCLALAACNEPLDYDLRGNVGGFSTASAVQTVTTDRPAADERGVISYPTYQVAVARRGDTPASIAARLGTDQDALARFNGVAADVTLREGEILALPNRVAEPAPGTPGAIDITTLAGSAIDSSESTPRVTETELQPAATSQSDVPGEPIRHKVTRGETAFSIARLYNVPVGALAEWNGLGPEFSIREGQYLLIPIANAPAPTQTAASEQSVTVPGQGSPTPAPPSAATPLPDETIPAAAAAAAPEPVDVGTPTRSTDARMSLPVKGRIIRDYNKGRNDGIDIAAAPGTAVSAAADGTVAAITSDADQIPIVVVRHPDNILTVYANVDGISVEKGDTVKRGQQIAKLRAGDDAYVHFEVREGFDSVDPNPYLN